MDGQPTSPGEDPNHRSLIPPALVDFYQANAAFQKPVGASGLVSAADIQSRSGLPWLSLSLPFWMPYQVMLAEAKSLRECFVPHRSQKEANQGWFSLCIHGLSSVHTGPHTRYGFTDNEAPYGWTDICKFAPVTHAFFSDLFGYLKYERVRFMLLEPGGYILPHVDATVDRLNAVNIALNQPSRCEFVMEGAGVVPFAPGKAFMLSLSRKHIVWNRSDEDRYHIIVHGRRDETIWDQIIIDSYQKVIASS